MYYKFYHSSYFILIISFEKFKKTLCKRDLVRFVAMYYIYIKVKCSRYRPGVAQRVVEV